MAQDIGTGEVYNTKIPSIDEIADIQKAFKYYHYGVEGSFAEGTTGIVGHLAQLQVNIDDLSSSTLSSLALKAPLASPDLTGNATAENLEVTGTFVNTGLSDALYLKAPKENPALTGTATAENLTVTGTFTNTGLSDALNLKAPKASPTFTGNTSIENLNVTGTFAHKSTEITASSSSSVALKITGASSQSANLQEWNNSTNTNLLSIDSSGKIARKLNSYGFEQTVSVNQPTPATFSYTYGPIDSVGIFNGFYYYNAILRFTLSTPLTYIIGSGTTISVYVGSNYVASGYAATTYNVGATSITLYSATYTQFYDQNSPGTLKLLSNNADIQNWQVDGTTVAAVKHDGSLNASKLTTNNLGYHTNDTLPAFEASMSTTPAAHAGVSPYTTYYILPFDSTNFNNQNCFNPTTSGADYCFSAPVSGVYHFDFYTAQSSTTASNLRILLLVDGTEYPEYTALLYANNNFTATISTTMYLSAGQYVQAAWKPNTTTSMKVYGSYAKFSGHLVG